MSFQAKFAFNKSLAEDGNWVELTDGFFVKVRRINSEFVSAFNKKLWKPYQYQLDKGLKVPEEVNEANGYRFASEALLVDWQGEIEDGVALPEYSSDLAVEAFKKYPDFLAAVVDASQEIGNFREERKVDRSKN